MAHHEPFKSLSPLSWTRDIAPRDPTSLSELLTSTLADAELLIDSIPTPTPYAASFAPHRSASGTKGSGSAGTGRARAQTDPPVPPTPVSSSSAATAEGKDDGQRAGIVKKLGRDWKDLKMHNQHQQKDQKGQNPHGIAMYKMPAKDGKGAWFARRSLHRICHADTPGGAAGGFEKWEAALRGEMQATLDRAAGKEPGSGNIRGIGAEKRVERRECEAGTVDLYHVSARFPGPTTPRDFVSLLIMPPAQETKAQEESGTKNRRPRQFMIVSRPCDHPDCPPRSGFIRGTYESVEVIREVPVEKPLRRVRSSIDLSRDELQAAEDGGGEGRLSKEAVLRAAKRAVGEEAESEGEQGKTVSFRLGDGSGGSDTEMAIEWLMVTRSDPGGSVPRFMVEKGTPGGIINDAGKFLKWLSSQTMEDLTKPRPAQTDGADERDARLTEEAAATGPGQVPRTTSVRDQLPDGEEEHHDEPAPNGSGIYSLLSSAIGTATSAVSRVASLVPVPKASDADLSDDESDTSEASFASAEEGSAPHPDTLARKDDNLDSISATDGLSTRSAHSLLSETTSQALSREPTPAAGFSQAQARHEKELRKLQERMRKAQEKLERAQARRRAKQGGGGGDDDADNTNSESPAAAGAATEGVDKDKDKDKDKGKDSEKEDEALAKLREKHAREVARQEEKYRRELRRLADKRAAEERKAAARRRKAAEREERADLAMALERARAERDVARKEAEMLRAAVAELQGQNTMLVARLGKAGVDVGELSKAGGKAGDGKGGGRQGGV